MFVLVPGTERVHHGDGGEQGQPLLVTYRPGQFFGDESAHG